MQQQIGIDEFLELAKQYPVLDVRSPGEYKHAHIPGAYNLPLFSDEERKVVGTTYKEQGREHAIKVGLDYFGPKMRKMVEEAEGLKSKIQNPKSKIPNNTVLVHCWRGGMRSAGVAWLLGLYGFKVYTLTGGYKSFRNWALQQFEKPYSFNIIGGYTGSGKTLMLKELAKKEHAIIDLEGIAQHKGSAFGGLGIEVQPTQEMFENVLASELHAIVNRFPNAEPIWIEDESRRIGPVNIPGALWETLRQAPLYFLEVPFEERLNYICEEYGNFKKTELVNSVVRIQKRLGGLDTKNAVSYLLEENYREAFRILLNYYDKYYRQSLHNNDIARALHTIECVCLDIQTNSKKLVDKKYAQDGVTNTGN